MSFFNRNVCPEAVPDFLTCQLPCCSDDNLEFRLLLRKVAEIDSKKDIPQSTYVVEECAECIDELTKLIKCITKNTRKKCDKLKVIEEACDVLCTIAVMLYQAGLTEREIKECMKRKYRRTINEYNTVRTDEILHDFESCGGKSDYEK